MAESPLEADRMTHDKMGVDLIIIIIIIIFV